MMPRRSHVWHTRAGRTECRWCSMRPEWEGASSPCSGVIPDLERNPEHRRAEARTRAQRISEIRERVRASLAPVAVPDEEKTRRARHAEEVRRWRAKKATA